MANGYKPLKIVVISQTAIGKKVFEWIFEGIHCAELEVVKWDRESSNESLSPNLSEAHCVLMEVSDDDEPETCTVYSEVIGDRTPHVLLVHHWENLALPCLGQRNNYGRFVLSLEDPKPESDEEKERKFALHAGASAYLDNGYSGNRRTLQFIRNTIVSMAIEEMKAQAEHVGSMITHHITTAFGGTA